jgi:hypothetical protein
MNTPQTNAARVNFIHWSEMELEYIHTPPQLDPEDGEWVPASLCEQIESDLINQSRKLLNLERRLRELISLWLSELRPAPQGCAQEVLNVLQGNEPSLWDGERNLYVTTKQ